MISFCKGEMMIEPSAVMAVPGTLTLRRWMEEGRARATDECRVAVDGVCEHGHPSWLVTMGMVKLKEVERG